MGAPSVGSSGRSGSRSAKGGKSAEVKRSYQDPMAASAAKMKGKYAPARSHASAATKSKGSSHTGHFQRVGQSVMNMVIFRKRMYLCLFRESSKRVREDNPVIIGQKRRTKCYIGFRSKRTKRRIIPMSQDKGHNNPLNKIAYLSIFPF